MGLAVFLGLSGFFVVLGLDVDFDDGFDVDELELDDDVEDGGGAWVVVTGGGGGGGGGGVYGGTPDEMYIVTVAPLRALPWGWV